METLFGIGIIFWIIIICFAIGAFLALPLIWYHIGYVSRKLSKVIELLEKIEKQNKIEKDA